MKRTIALILTLILLPGIGFPAAGKAAQPIASGTVNKTTQIRWGKGTQFPVIATVYAGTKLDVYEYDAQWALVLYKTYVSYMGNTREHSCFGYIRRADITCSPPLQGTASPKADTGPGKRKGRRKKPSLSLPPVEATPDRTMPPAPTVEPDITVEPMEEFDWIIRTNGLQIQQVVTDGLFFDCVFALMAQKAGGVSASSDPAYNQGIRTPYAATALFYIIKTTASFISDLGVSDISGSGGVDLNFQATGAKFYIDTGAQSFALVNFTLPMNGYANIAGRVWGSEGSTDFDYSSSGEWPVACQLKGNGRTYKLVIVGMRPGGGDLEYPLVLERTFADPDRFDKMARDADAKRKKLEAERDKMLEEWRKWAEEQQKKEKEQSATLLPPVPLVTENTQSVTLPPPVPLVTDNTQSVTLPPPVPLVTDNAETNTLPEPVPLVTDGQQTTALPAPVPLVPSPGDEAPPFPGQSGGLERREDRCA